MLTPLGKQIRVLRLDKHIRLKDMAEAFGVRSSFLSALENGRKSLPEGWIKKLDQYFAGMGLKESDWGKLAELSRPKISIDLEDANEFDRETCLVFGRHFLDLPLERKEKIRRLLGDS
jgi:HTH-type transcriptional regulator, competence development regulator